MVCAIKTLLRKDCVLDINEKTVREVIVHREIQHQFVADFYHSLRDRKHIYILLEVVLGPGVTSFSLLLPTFFSLHCSLSGSQQFSSTSLPLADGHHGLFCGPGGTGNRPHPQ